MNKAGASPRHQHGPATHKGPTFPYQELSRLGPPMLYWQTRVARCYTSPPNINKDFFFGGGQYNLPEEPSNKYHILHKVFKPEKTQFGLMIPVGADGEDR